DDVDAGALGEDEPAHLGIPATRLMTEMDARFQQILQLRLRHALPLEGFDPPPPSSPDATPQGPGTGSSNVSVRGSGLGLRGSASRLKTEAPAPNPESHHHFLNWNRLHPPARPGLLRSPPHGTPVAR